MKKCKLIFGIVGIITLMAVNISIEKSDIDSASTLSLGKLITSAFSDPENPFELSSPEVHVEKGSCFSCYYDIFGGLEQICDAYSYWTLCVYDPEGIPGCVDGQHVDCTNENCELTGRGC